MEVKTVEEVKEIIAENEAIKTVVAATDALSEEQLAHVVAKDIKYTMIKDILVKQLADIMITREFDVPVVSGITYDEGEAINEYEETSKEIKEVPSVFAEGIVLKLPIGGCEFLKIGDRVVYNRRFAVEFDLYKDTKLVKPYDIIAKIAA